MSRILAIVFIFLLTALFLFMKNGKNNGKMKINNALTRTIIFCGILIFLIIFFISRRMFLPLAVVLLAGFAIGRYFYDMHKNSSDE